MALSTTDTQKLAQRMFTPQQNPLYPNPSAPDPSQAAQPQTSAPLASNPPQPATPAPSPAPPTTPGPTSGPKPGEISAAMTNPPEQAAPPVNAPIANAPTPFHHGTLAKVLLGLGEAVGNPLATHIGERDRARQNEVDEYSRNLPAAQNQANLAQQQKLEEISHLQAQTHLENVNADLAQQNLPLQESVSKHYQTLLQTWQNKAVPDFDKYAQSYLQGLPPVMARMLAPHLDAIKQTPQVGKGYTVNMQDDLPTSVNVYGKDYDRNDPELAKLPVGQQAIADFDRAAGAHQTKIGEEESKEKRVAGYAADRQAQAFTNQQTEQGRKAATESLKEINDAKGQQQMIEKLLSGKMNPASQTAAMFKMIGLEQPTGTHRIMPAEVEGIEHLGGLSDRLKQKLLNWKEGDRFSPDMVPDVISTAKVLSQSKIKTANDNLESTSRIYGYKAPGADAKGRLDKPEDYQDETPQGGGPKAAPQGATHVGVSSVDGKKYYLDAQGKKLGPAE